MAAHETGRRVVGVVSAMGKTTDQLVALAAEVSPRPHPREMDMLLSTGERISAALCAMAIEDLGHRAVSLTGSQAGIVTDTVHTKAKIVEIRPRRIDEALARGEIVLVAGFQGVSTAYDVTTLGRGGSDTTAVALAAALGRRLRDLHRRRRRLHAPIRASSPSARKLPQVSPPRCSRWPASGARVLQLRSVEFARNHGVPIHVRSTFSDAGGDLDPRGREHGRRDHLRHHPHTRRGVCHADRRAGQAGHRGRASSMRSPAPHINVDTIIQNAVTHGDADVTFSIPPDDLPLMTDTIEDLCGELGLHWRVDDDAGKVSLIGAGMKSHPGVAAKMFQTLAEHDINVRMIATSPIKVSCVIARAKVTEAVRALHDAFAAELDLRSAGRHSV